MPTSTAILSGNAQYQLENTANVIAVDPKTGALTYNTSVGIRRISGTGTGFSGTLTVALQQTDPGVGDSGWIETVPVTFGTATYREIYSGVPTSQIPSNPAVGVDFTVAIQSGTSLGTATATVRLVAAPAPTVTGFSASDANNSVSSIVGAYVQGLSVLKLDQILATPQPGTTITDTRLRIEGSDLRIDDTRALLNSGTIPVISQAWDNKGGAGSLAGSISVLKYVSPYMFGAARRSNSAGAALNDGTYLSIPLDAYVKSLVNSTERNTLTVRILTRPLDSATWTVRNTITPTTTAVGSGADIYRRYQATVVVGGGAIYNANTSYAVRVELIDQFNTVSVDHTVATAYVAVDLNGFSVGIGKLHERGTLDVGGSGHFLGVYTTPQIVTDANLAKYGGLWQIAAGGANLPAGLSGTLNITTTLTPNTLLPTQTILAQRVESIGGGSDVWVRYGVYNPVTDVASGWEAWKRIDGYSYRETVRFTSSGTFTKSAYPWLRAVKVMLVGGGGAGGSVPATSAGVHSTGSGGGGGGYAEKFIASNDIGGSVAVTVGAGGSPVAGGTGTPGGSGSSSSFGALVVASGGVGGENYASNANYVIGQVGVGGTGTAGDRMLPGATGSSGGGMATFGFGGGGGDSQLGVGGGAVYTPVTAASVAGKPGDGYGGGGSGAGGNASSPARLGGAGSPGVVVVELYA